MDARTDPAPQATELVATGIAGLDDILGGGFTPRRLYLLEGAPGTGKTTLALQFLREGARRGETVLHVTLSETEEELRDIAASHGLSMEGIHVRELVPSPTGLLPDSQYTMFHPSEVELAETTKLLIADVDRLRPTRVVIDSMSELGLVAGTPLRFRRQIIALKGYLAARGCTVLLLDDQSRKHEGLEVQTVAHGVIQLEQLHPEYGSERRRLRVVKYRGMSYRGGHHDFSIRRGGLEVYPRLVAAEHRKAAAHDRIATGVAGFDEILGGGIERGTSTLLLGAAGTGKSSLAAQFVASAAAAGHRASMFLFDESVSMLLKRTAGLSIDLRPHVDSGRVQLQQVDPAELSPGQFVDAIRQAVEVRGVTVVVIDSLNGYLSAMPGERFLTVQLHEVLAYLGQMGVITILIGTQQGLIGAHMSTTVDASYLADSVIMLRYFEARGEVRQAISVIKKRGGGHERTIREFRLEKSGIRVGEPLRQFTGVLTGTPRYDGDGPSLLERRTP